MAESTLETPARRTLRLADGRTLGYREVGSGPAVLLLHGWPTSSFLWRRVMVPIARDHRALALDLPGFGASDKPVDARYDFDFFEEAIDGFLARLGIDELAIAGHDLGGPVAVRWALRRQQRVTSLALLNTLIYPEFSDAVLHFVTTLSDPKSRDRLTAPEALAEIMRLGVVDAGRLSDDVLAGVQQPFASPEARLALARAGIGLEAEIFGEIARDLPSIGLPVRVIYGEQDRILPDVAETMARLQRDLPQVEVTAFPDCGHFLQEEHPERIGQLLARFFSAANAR